MIRLLQIELFKLWNNRMIKVMIFLYFGLLSLLILLSSIRISFGFFTLDLAREGIFDFPMIWNIVTFTASWFKVFLAIIVVNSVTMEYSGRTLKQNLIDGLSKKEFILSKFYGLVFFALLSTVFLYVISSILGLVYSKEEFLGNYFHEIYLIPAYFLKHVVFLSIFLFVGMIVRKSAITLGIVFIALVLEFILVQVLHFKYGMIDLATQLRETLPLLSPYYLTPEPISRFETIQRAGEALGSNVLYDNLPTLKNFVVSGVWTFVFVFGSYRVLKRKDL